MTEMTSPLDEAAKTATAAALNRVLADLIDLTLVGKQAHWTLVGPRFRTLHLQLDELVDAVRVHADDVAERVVTIGVTPDGRAATVAAESALPEHPTGWAKDTDVVDYFVRALRTTIDRLREAIEETEKTDVVSQDLLIGITADLEKTMWMFQAALLSGASRVACRSRARGGRMSTERAERMARAKRPRSPLAGSYGHPVHPILVTAPIGAWVASLVFDLMAAFGDEPEVFARGAYWLVVIGIVGALLAALAGLLDLTVIPRGTRAFRTALTHVAINSAVVVLFLVSLVLRSAVGTDRSSTAAVGLSIVALALLGVSGWLGGRLAYTFGVRVAGEETQADAYR